MRSVACGAEMILMNVIEEETLPCDGFFVNGPLLKGGANLFYDRLDQ
jgi:hypothetical protein